MDKITRRAFRLSSIVMVVYLSGCATIVYGTRETVYFDSVPSGAKVTMGIKEFQTPHTENLKKDIGKDFLVTFEKEGYKKKQVELDRSYHWVAAILGNIFWLLPGLVVDFVSGGAMDLEPDHVHVVLEPESPSKGQ